MKLRVPGLSFGTRPARKRRDRADAPKTLVPDPDRANLESERPHADAPAAERIDAARVRLRSAIPPRPEDD